LSQSKKQQVTQATPVTQRCENKKTRAGGAGEGRRASSSIDQEYEPRPVVGADLEKREAGLREPCFPGSKSARAR
jgi:hypothetical protein